MEMRRQQIYLTLSITEQSQKWMESLATVNILLFTGIYISGHLYIRDIIAMLTESEKCYKKKTKNILPTVNNVSDVQGEINK